MREACVNALGALGLVAIAAGAGLDTWKARPPGGPLPVSAAPAREWRALGPGDAPRLHGGQRYALAVLPGGGHATMRLRWARRWRFALSRPVALHLPGLRRVPAEAPWAAAYEADLAPGVHALRLDGPTDFLAIPLGDPPGRAR